MYRDDTANTCIHKIPQICRALQFYLIRMLIVGYTATKYAIRLFEF